MNTGRSIYVLKRIGLALAMGAVMCATTCTLTDLLSTYGLSQLLSSLSSTGA